MGFAVRTCCNAHSSPRRFPSPRYPPLPFPVSAGRIAFTSRQRKIRLVMTAAHHQETLFLHSGGSTAKRVILFMGFALIPLLGIGMKAIEGRAAENIELEETDEKHKEKGNSSQNPIVSLLNALGILGSGVLAALFFSTKKLKSKSDEIIESMEIELEKRNAAIASLENEMVMELAKEKEVRNHAIEKAKEEQQSLKKRLALADNTITCMGKELRHQKRLAEELIPQVNDLEIRLHESVAEREDLEQLLKSKLESEAVWQEKVSLLSSVIKEKDDDLCRLNSKLGEKERAVSELGRASEEMKKQLAALKLAVKELQDSAVEKEKELEGKSEKMEVLEEELKLSVAEKDEILMKLHAIQEEYMLFKSKTEENLNQLGERDSKIQQLEEQLVSTMEDLKNKKEMVSSLYMEMEILKGNLKVETENTRALEQELRITREALVKSRDEASDLAKQLHQSRSKCSELEADVSKAKAEFNGDRESLQRELDQSKKHAKALAFEVASANEVLRKSHSELQSMCQELCAAMEERDKLKIELMEAAQKAETAAINLEKEAHITSSLRNELTTLRDESFKDREARRSLEANLKDTTEALDEMNQSTVKLLKELELANSEMSRLGYENDALHEALDQREGSGNGVQQDLEDARKMVVALGTERERLDGKAKKLEEELACAKGEILKLRCRAKASKARGEAGKDGEGDEKPPKKAVRRRRATPRQET